MYFKIQILVLILWKIFTDFLTAKLLRPNEFSVLYTEKVLDQFIMDEQAFRDLYALSHSFSEFDGVKILYEIIHLNHLPQSSYVTGFLKRVKTQQFGSALHDWICNMYKCDSDLSVPRRSDRSHQIPLKTSKILTPRSKRVEKALCISDLPVVRFTDPESHRVISAIADSLTGNTYVCTVIHKDSTCVACKYFTNKGSQSGALPWKYFKLLKKLHSGMLTEHSIRTKLVKFQPSKFENTIAIPSTSSRSEDGMETDSTVGSVVKKSSESRSQRKRRLIQQDVSNAVESSLLEQDLIALKRFLSNNNVATLGTRIEKDLKGEFVRLHGHAQSQPFSDPRMTEIIKTRVVEGETRKRVIQRKKKKR